MMSVKFFFSLLYLSFVRMDMLCSAYCKCEHRSATCDGSNKTVKLTYIPKFPSDITKVVFINNNISNLSRSTLKNLSPLTITNLDLKNNKITIIHKDTFADMKHLFKLDISGNDQVRIENVQNCLRSLPSTLHELLLNHMLWHPLNNMNTMFDGLKKGQIRKIELSHSYLKPFSGKWFAGLNSLTDIDISWNSIGDKDLNFKGLNNLKWLSLIGNYLNYVPDFCTGDLYKLETLLLSNTRLAHLINLQNNTRCLRQLTTLHLNGIAVPIIPNNAFSELESLKVLEMTKMSTQLKKILPLAFNSSSLSSLSYSKSDRFIFCKTGVQMGYFEPKTLFKFCPSLTMLDLSHNFIEFTNQEIRDMFSPLINLREIKLQYLDLVLMPRHFFHQFPRLQGIYLDHNMILPWTNGKEIFQGLTNLTELHISSNRIGHFSSTSFPENILKTLKSIDLTGNQFSCTCKLTWFKHWMKNTKVKLLNETYYNCDDRTKLQDYNPTYIACSNIIFLITVSVGGGVCFLLAATILVYSCRWRIRFHIYKILSSSHYYQQIDGDDYRYSAYVIYCYEDFKWVKHELIPKMEEKHGLHLCIPHRDFELGKVFADNIVEHMNLSKTVITVLSNNFAKNEWCLFQLAVARSKLSKDGTFSIFPVMLEEIDFKNMNSSLYSLIKLSSYAAWNFDERGVELFWEQVINHVQ
ncbi:toll-like receptor 13 [Mytilus galloprovincialis]|uniref:Toll-like receptor 13 n=2 Tax=Mytilus galloprovincialis TaxID=29158 RepID=A0A8B6G158_MYTGA|nr:toll-like receptor 13 [Mytilus galloprovincialis]